MNPLDKEELSEILEIIKNDMPIHTDTTAKIKNSFSQGFPKNLMDYSVKVDNKFLNDNLGIIEEINYKNLKHWIPKWFQKYQNKIYGDSDILNHDNFFKTKLHDSFFKYQDEYDMPKNTRYYGNMNIKNVGFISPKTPSCTHGATLIPVTTNRTDVLTLGYIYCTSATGTATQCYNQIGINVHTNSGNIRLGNYDEVSGVPTNLQVELDSTASVGTGVNYYNVTEFSLATNNNWICGQASSSSLMVFSQTGAGNRYKAYTYGAFPNPITSTTSTTVPYDFRLKHS